MDGYDKVFVDPINSGCNNKNFRTPIPSSTISPSSLDSSFNNSIQNHILSLQKLPHYPAYLSYPGSSASTRSLLSGYHKKKRCGTSSCACRVAVMIILVLLFVWGVTIPLYFFGEYICVWL